MAHAARSCLSWLPLHLLHGDLRLRATVPWSVNGCRHEAVLGTRFLDCGCPPTAIAPPFVCSLHSSLASSFLIGSRSDLEPLAVGKSRGRVTVQRWWWHASPSSLLPPSFCCTFPPSFPSMPSLSFFFCPLYSCLVLARRFALFTGAGACGALISLYGPYCGHASLSPIFKRDL